MAFSKLRRNELFEAVDAGGLRPESFEFTEDTWGARLKHRSSDAAILVEWLQPRRLRLNAIMSAFVPGGSTPMSMVVSWKMPDASWRKVEVADWEGAVNRVRECVTEIRLDIEAPDLWEALKDGGVRMGDPSDNSPFTGEEHEEIAERVAAIKGQFGNQQLDAEQMRLLAAKLDFLVVEAGRMGRIDWRNLVIGTMFGMLSDALLPADATRHAFSTLLHSVSHLLGHPVSLLPGP